MRVLQDFGKESRPVRVGSRAVPAVYEVQIDEDGRPSLLLRFEVKDGLPQCRRLELSSGEDGREVLATDLRDVRLGDLLELATARVSNVFEMQQQEDGRVFTRMTPVMTFEDARETIGQVRSIRKEARRIVTDELLRRVAQVYRDNVDNNPTIAVADHTKRKHRTAALYIKQARERTDPETGDPFLGRAMIGKAGEQS